MLQILAITDTGNGLLPDLYQAQFWLIISQTIKYIYHKVSNIRRTLVGNKIVAHSDVVGASPVGAAQTTSSFTT